MALINDIVNDKSLPLEERVLMAVNLINNPIDEESIPNAICWIGYRTLDRGIDPFLYTKYKDTPYNVAGAGLKSRWLMSLSTIDLYIDIMSGCVDECKLRNASLLWINKDVKTLWPPQILNYIRCSTLYAYYFYLTDRYVECIDLCVNTIDQWKISTCSFDIGKHPYRFTEMRDDFKCLQILVFLLRECGHLSFTDRSWMNLEIVNEKINDEPIFNKVLRVFGNINPEKALWKQQ